MEKNEELIEPIANFHERMMEIIVEEYIGNPYEKKSIFGGRGSRLIKSDKLIGFIYNHTSIDNMYSYFSSADVCELPFGLTLEQIKDSIRKEESKRGFLEEELLKKHSYYGIFTTIDESIFNQDIPKKKNPGCYPKNTSKVMQNIFLNEYKKRYKNKYKDVVCGEYHNMLFGYHANIMYSLEKGLTIKDQIDYLRNKIKDLTELTSRYVSILNDSKFISTSHQYKERLKEIKEYERILSEWKVIRYNKGKSQK